MGDAARPAATGDNIIRPVFDGRIKTQNYCNKKGSTCNISDPFNPFSNNPMFSTTLRKNDFDKTVKIKTGV